MKKHADTLYIIFFFRSIKLSMEMGNVSNRQQPDQKVETQITNGFAT